MAKSSYLIAYDIGTTALKTCVFSLDGALTLRAFSQQPYSLAVFPDGGAEQQPEDWWNAMCATTREALSSAGLQPGEIAGLSFCSQMQGLVLADKDGNPVRPAMSYMDQRAVEEYQSGMAFGLQLNGINVFRLLRSLAITKAVAGSVKDPVWKYKWVQRREPEVFSRVYKWLDVKEFLISRCTGEFVMTADSAFATLLYDVRPGHAGFSHEMCNMLGVDYEHLPRIIRSTDQAGGLTARAAAALGLQEGTPVFGGGGDASLIGVGAGAVDVGSTHLYMGTSGWVSTVIDQPTLDISAMIAGVVGAEPGYYNYFAELETAGKCLEWVKNHLALDEIGVYLQKVHVSDGQEAVYRSLYDYMMHVIASIPAGSNGVLFTPWLHGNRCPFEDASARGMFFNIGLETGKTELIRSVIEGVCYHMRWMLEAQQKKVKTSAVVRFVGGGALAQLTCQILADVLGRPVETVNDPQNVGAVGAALVAAVGLGAFPNLAQAKALVPACCRYEPNPENKAVYDNGFAVFKNLYVVNKKNFAALNKVTAERQTASVAASI